MREQCDITTGLRRWRCWAVRCTAVCVGTRLKEIPTMPCAADETLLPGRGCRAAIAQIGMVPKNTTSLQSAHGVEHGCTDRGPLVAYWWPADSKNNKHKRSEN
ncbi:hypothetical protein evm_000982 [Chilo suppressalis]|nr:hypothetical protein evm_000982 [Chilo suppressalis]